MKNLLISLAVTFIICISFGKASAEPYTKNVVQVIVKNTKSHEVLFDSGKEDERTKPFTTHRKSCPGDQKRECLYVVEGKNERKLYEFKADSLIMVVYITRTTVVELP